MPRYTFTGPFETILEGLSHGVNAVLHRRDEDGGDVEHGQPEGSTVVVRPGDQVVTDEAYPHPHMVNVETEKPDEAIPTVHDGDSFVAGAPSDDNTIPSAVIGEVQPTAPTGSENPPPPGNPPAETAQTTITAEGQE